MPLKQHEIKVWGRGSFPLDMLRYDQATPVSAEDAAKIESTFTIPRKHVRLTEGNPIFLYCYWNLLRWDPSYERWGSFMWTARVVE